MKYILICCWLVFGSIAALAQADQEKPIQNATDDLIALYDLDSKQAGIMFTIQERKFRNLKEVKSLKTEKPDLYLQKRKSINKGTDSSIKRLLTPEQMTVYQTLQLEKRKKHSEMIKKMKSQGATKKEIEKALLELE